VHLLLRRKREMGDTPDEHGNFTVEGQDVAVGPGHTTFDPTRLDFGHYAGQTIEELASVDPDYLRWLARTPSGARYRVEIERILGPLPTVSL
jgi:hypothetical protein